MLCPTDSPCSEQKPRWRRLLIVLLPPMALAVVWYAFHRISHHPWPFASADPLWLTLASAIVALSYLLRAIGWRYLFGGAPAERPERSTLVTASSAASLGGFVLPGRSDWLVKIFVLRRSRRRPSIELVLVSLCSLGLVDAITILPLASAGAATSPSIPLAGAQAFVAFCGLLALLLICSVAGARRLFCRLPWRRPRTALLTICDGLCDLKAALRAAVPVCLGWLARSIGMLMLAVALGIHPTPALALAFVTLTAAAQVVAFIPIGPSLQIGTGAVVLTAFGVSLAHAATFALAANMLYLFAAAASSLLGLLVYHRRRLLPLAFAY